METSSTIQKYDLSAEEYEKKWHRYLAHTLGRFLTQIIINGNDNVLDVSGGTGLLEEELLKENYPFRHLVVNDPSKGMLAVAKDRLPENCNISYTNYRADRLPFKKNRFDRIFCLNAFHFYQNQQQVLDILHFILKPGGKLFLLDWNRSGLFRFINKLITWSTSEYINTRSLPETEEMLETSGFKISSSESWYWWYWKFLFVEAQK